MWTIISSPFKQQPPVTVIFPTKPTMSIHISPPIHVLRLEPACSATSQHFHLPPKYKDAHVMMNLSIYNANLDIINISSTLFRITQHIPSVQQQEMLERLAALPPVPIKRITMELMGEVLQDYKTTLNKIAVFVNFQVLTMAKMDTKVKNQDLTNILHCSVDRKMVL